MASSPSSAARRLLSTPAPMPSAHTKKRTSRPALFTQALSDRQKQHRLRERQRTLQNIRVGSSIESSPQAVHMTDPWASTESVPAYTGLTLPRQLERAPLRAPRPEALAAVDPGLEDTNIEYIKDCMELRGEQMYTTLRYTSILTLHKPHGPHCFPTSARVRVTHAHADLPTHLLAVRSCLPDGRDLADDLSRSNPSTSPLRPRPAAHYTPIHALTLAVYAPLVVPLPTSDPSLQLPSDFDPDLDAGSTVDLTLPVVVMRVPSPRTLGMLLAILYSQRYDNLVKALLGIPLSSPHSDSPQTQSTLLTQSVFSQLFSPLSELPPPSPPSPSPLSAAEARNTRLTSRLMHMSRLLALGYLNPMDKEDTGDIANAAAAIIYRTRITQALAANARALGVCDLAFWGAIDVAWAVLLGALGLVAGSASASAPLSPDTPYQNSMAEDSA